jgi:hypothetical protein
MRQIEPDRTTQNGLMLGPDGMVHVVPARAGRNLRPPVEMEGRSVAGQQDLSLERDAGLFGIRRMPQGTSCFSYSAPLPSAEGDILRAPQGGVCFTYSASMPSAEGDILRAPGKGSICFSYATRRPPTDREMARRALQDIRRMPQTGVCFSY